MELQNYEIKHLQTVEEISSECCLFLKRNDDFPLNKSTVKEIGLYGNGIRHTLKGGTGSGNVESHIFNNIETAFENCGIKVISKSYLDSYDEILKKAEDNFVVEMKKKAKKEKIPAVKYFFGKALTEPDYDLKDKIIPCSTSIYVLSRKMGEGNDRENIKGQFKLTDTEIDTIQFLQSNSQKFLLVLNVGAPIDISEIIPCVDNILLISYLGQRTSETLVNIIFGDAYPSGKLPISWDKYENYPSLNFGDINNTYYEEGIFVGYRHFATINRNPMFPFGFGVSYTSFILEFVNVTKNKDEFNIQIKVKNIGEHKGKEVVQLYLSKPSTIDFVNPSIELVAFRKTNEILPNQEELIDVNFKLSNFANFDSKKSSYVIKKGVYLIKYGNASNDLKCCASFEVNEDIILERVKEYKHDIYLKEKRYEFISNYSKSDKHFILEKDDFCIEKPIKNHINHTKFDFVSSLKDNELIKLTMGNISPGIKGMIGDSCESVLGGAGETCLSVPTVKNSLVLADGPAGVRIASECLLSKNKKYKLSVDPMWEDLSKYLPKFITSLVLNKKNLKRKGNRYYQYTTSIPVANALASSFSTEVVSKCGMLIAEEMTRFGVDVILSPSMNIVRNPLCGRNFEYYSEDPFLTSYLVSSFISSIQNNGKSKACVKHYLCNNQENNRFQSNSIVSNRAIREIYLKPFISVIKSSNPYSLMTSYNLLNGEHTSESSYFTKYVLRDELKYDGLILTDWINSGAINNPNSINKTVYAHNAINAGVNLLMPGGKSDIKDLKIALKNGAISKKTLIENVCFIINKIVENSLAKS